MTNNEILNQTTGTTGRYNPMFRELGLGLIRTWVKGGDDLILLEELYRTFRITDLGGNQANGIQWAVADAKKANLIEATEIRGCYRVIA